MTHLMGFACLNTQINLLTKDDRLRSENIIRLKDIYEELPSALMVISSVLLLSVFGSLN
jgi:hypothetical protein